MRGAERSGAVQSAVPCPPRSPRPPRGGRRPGPPLEPAAAARYGRADGAVPSAVTNGSAPLFK